MESDLGACLEQLRGKRGPSLITGQRHLGIKIANAKTDVSQGL